VDRRTRNVFAVALLAVIALAGAAAFLVGGSGVRRPDGPTNAESVVGVIVGVKSEALDQVTGFTLRTTDQTTLVFAVGDLENGAVFPPGHLVEHQATAQPVRVWYRTEAGARIAIRLEDAT
jgi:hypothetical protein